MAKAATHIQTLFALAHTDVGRVPFNNQGRTLRLVCESNIETTALTVYFSNRCGSAPQPVGAASIARCDKDGTLQPDTLMPLTVNGTLAFEIPVEQELASDSVSFPLQPGDFFALNLYYPAGHPVASGNWLGQGAHRSRPGNFSADLKLPGPNIVSRLARTVIETDMTVTITSVCRIEAACPRPTRLLACFGDSITEQSNWTTPLAKLLYHCYPGEITLCNLGISGNRLLADSAESLGGLHGIAGVRRFDEDVLALPGLTHAIVALGSNDIGLPGSHGLPVSDVPSLAEYIDAMTLLAQKLRQRGVVPIVATVAPRAMVRPYSEEREALRLSMNGWIRTTDAYDAVLDFDAVLRREDGKPGMKEGYALPDGLHPTPLAGLWMAKSIDLSLFGGASP